MKTIRTIGGVLLPVLLLMLAACSSKPVETKTLQTQSGQTVHYKVPIHAQSYTWRQLSGIRVALTDPYTPILHFVAPVVRTKERVLFELEAAKSFGVQRLRVEVIISPAGDKEENATQEGDDTNTTTGGGNDGNVTGGDDDTVDGDDNGTTGGGSDDNRSDTQVPLAVMLPDTLRHALADHVIPYDRITLEVNATSALRLTAVNDTLAKEHNRTIALHGHKNNGLFYLYNLPLVPGANRIHIRVANAAGETSEANLTVQADANRSVPIAMRAARYEGIKRLDTAVEVGTDLNASEYLFDLESDGTIETVQSEGNFSLRLTEEGRYRPRVTVRTKEGLLYSSGPYALALDVKADASQKDPKGATPIDVAKGFVQALMEDDRERVERLTGYSKNLLHFIYGNPQALKRAKSLAKTIDPDSWRQTYRPNGSIEVRAEGYENGYGKFPIVFEIMPAYGDGTGYGRMLYVSDLH